MRLNIAKVVEGCWYRRLKVIPGSCSRYWESEFVLDVPIDMVTEGENYTDWRFLKSRRSREKREERKEEERREKECGTNDDGC